MRLIFLDSQPLSALSNSKDTSEKFALQAWAQRHLDAGNRICIAAITDYEVRRELTRAGKANSLIVLDALYTVFDHIALTDNALRKAARLWADLRNRRLATADPKNIDIDVILAAQALVFAEEEDVDAGDVVVATQNVGHLARLLAAQVWSEIAA